MAAWLADVLVELGDDVVLAGGKVLAGQAIGQGRGIPDARKRSPSEIMVPADRLCPAIGGRVGRTWQVGKTYPDPDLCRAILLVF